MLQTKKTGNGRLMSACVCVYDYVVGRCASGWWCSLLSPFLPNFLFLPLTYVLHMCHLLIQKLSLGHPSCIQENSSLIE